MTRSDLVETIARRICASDYERCESFGGEKCDCSRWHLFTPDAEAALVAISEGYAVVPREATIEMLAAGWDAVRKGRATEPRIFGPGNGLKEAYAGMIQAGDVAKETTT